ncbi:alpha/beta fold hydrolase [Pseudorhodobacter sp. W20_MBD10_FR17]|uniref:alpha/beta fold hydrolase n=1 Tax=Pseudorhodobacter sp. W20_MBD10_FR17 TaxID=3240266 RepID=UPI003F9968F3
MFDGFLNALGVGPAQRYVVELDRPSVDDYQPIFDGLSEDTIVCGFSLGAIVAAHYADRMTAHHLVLFGVNPLADDPAKAQSRHDLAADVIRCGGAAALQARELEVHGPTPDVTREMVYEMANASANMIETQTQLALSRPGALPALSSACMPVISFTGSLDRSAPTVQGLAAAQSAPDGQFCALEGLGHFALIEDPHACAAALRHLMETHDAPAIHHHAD